MNNYSFDAICQMGKLTNTVNAAGDVKEIVVFGDEIFCCEKSVGYKEIQAGAARDFRPDVILIMPSDAYELERYVKYKEEIYKVVNTYKFGENVELTLERD